MNGLAAGLFRKIFQVNWHLRFVTFKTNVHSNLAVRSGEKFEKSEILGIVIGGAPSSLVQTPEELSYL
jgi:hypothetical protein